ncbi:MAG: 23S rRNA (guanosine(2251)-2'-O)-methyltransferase RlmB [Methylococcus sp.]|nr:MAG: 23S rRNA (guanosine(2251)-2'-O)-methyltransferase RlmB [Methylococcus sp.]
MSDHTRLGGIHAVHAALQNTAEKIVGAWLDQQRQDQRIREIANDLATAGIPVEPVHRKQLDSLFKGGNHQGIVIEVLLPREKTEKDLFEAIDSISGAPFYLVLDQVQDPHNLGACLRTSDAVGVHGIITPRDNATGITPAVCKVASGAAETIPVYRVTNLARTLRQMKKSGLWIIGTGGDARETVYNTDLTGPLALVIGAEGHGLRRLTKEHCDLIVGLPMAGTVESLNLSVAAGVLLYEILRQRNVPADPD